MVEDDMVDTNLAKSQWPTVDVGATLLLYYWWWWEDRVQRTHKRYGVILLSST